MKNIITLNLPGSHAADLPNPGKPVIEINGVALEHVIALDFHLDVRERKLSTVTVTFHPEGVDGQLIVEDDAYKVETLKLGGGNEDRN